MKPLIIALSFALVAGTTFARSAHSPAAAASDPAAVSTASATTAATPQRSKMKTCNADAKTKDIHGADRRAFMKQCLSGKAKPATAS